MGYDIGPRLRKYREAQNLSQKEFANLIEVNNSRVSNWEHGINRPDVDILGKIFEVLKVSANELLDIYILSNEGINIDDDVKQLVRQYHTLSAKDKEIIKSIVNSLSEKTVTHTK